MDTPRDEPARVRFARYRGLKSLRTSPWDAYENLPTDYARIFQFENFKRTKTKVIKDLEVAEGKWEGIEAGRKVVVFIEGVPARVMGEFWCEIFFVCVLYFFFVFFFGFRS